MRVSCGSAEQPAAAGAAHRRNPRPEGASGTGFREYRTDRRSRTLRTGSGKGGFRGKRKGAATLLQRLYISFETGYFPANTAALRGRNAFPGTRSRQHTGQQCIRTADVRGGPGADCRRSSRKQPDRMPQRRPEPVPQAAKALTDKFRHRQGRRLPARKFDGPRSCRRPDPPACQNAYPNPTDR